MALDRQRLGSHLARVDRTRAESAEVFVVVMTNTLGPLELDRLVTARDAYIRSLERLAEVVREELSG